MTIGEREKKICVSIRIFHYPFGTMLSLINFHVSYTRPFGGSDSKESACNAGNLGSIPGLGSLGWDDLLEKEMATHSRFLTGKFHGQKCLVGYSAQSHKELDTSD